MYLSTFYGIMLPYRIKVSRFNNMSNSKEAQKNILNEHVFYLHCFWITYPHFVTFFTLPIASITWRSNTWFSLVMSIFRHHLCLFYILKVSTIIIMVLAFFNILIIMCFVCIGYFHVNHDNWTDPPGFFAHGFTGVSNFVLWTWILWSNYTHAILLICYP